MKKKPEAFLYFICATQMNYLEIIEAQFQFQPFK